MAGPTVVTAGSDALKERLLKRMFTGEDAWCQLFSEPGAGSDLAGLGTQAVRDGDEWVISGQKVWNTLAHIADRACSSPGPTPTPPSTRASPTSPSTCTPLASRSAAAPDHGEAEFNEVYMTRRAGARRRPHRRRGRGLAGRHDHAHERADHDRRGGGTPTRGSGAIAEAVRIWKEEVREQRPPSATS